jgi:hypothetical protein
VSEATLAGCSDGAERASTLVGRVEGADLVEVIERGGHPAVAAMRLGFALLT